MSNNLEKHTTPENKERKPRLKEFFGKEIIKRELVE